MKSPMIIYKLSGIFLYRKHIDYYFKSMLKFICISIKELLVQMNILVDAAKKCIRKPKFHQISTHTQKKLRTSKQRKWNLFWIFKKEKTNDLNLLAPAQTWPPPLIPLPRAANQKKNNNNLIIFNEIFVRLNLLTCCLFLAVLLECVHPLFPDSYVSIFICLFHLNPILWLKIWLP